MPSDVDHVLHVNSETDDATFYASHLCIYLIRKLLTYTDMVRDVDVSQSTVKAWFSVLWARTLCQLARFEAVQWRGRNAVTGLHDLHDWFRPCKLLYVNLSVKIREIGCGNNTAAYF